MESRRDRERRLSAALRENLRRRKAQARERLDESGGGGGQEVAPVPDADAANPKGED